MLATLLLLLTHNAIHATIPTQSMCAKETLTTSRPTGIPLGLGAACQTMAQTPTAALVVTSGISQIL